MLTHFEAEPEEWQGQPDFLLGSDWQVDVTELVRDSLRVADERVAKLSEEQVLIGLNTGITKVQVRNRKNVCVIMSKNDVMYNKTNVCEYLHRK